MPLKRKLPGSIAGAAASTGKKQKQNSITSFFGAPSTSPSSNVTAATTAAGNAPTSSPSAATTAADPDADATTTSASLQDSTTTTAAPAPAHTSNLTSSLPALPRPKFDKEKWAASLPAATRDLLKLEIETLHESWLGVLKEEVTTASFLDLKRFLAKERAAGKKIFPREEEVYSWYEFC